MYAVLGARKKDKEDRLGDLLATIDAGQVIIFVHTREAVDALVRQAEVEAAIRACSAR